jgi:hypothetical protein
MIRPGASQCITLKYKSASRCRPTADVEMLAKLKSLLVPRIIIAISTRGFSSKCARRLGVLARCWSTHCTARRPVITIWSRRGTVHGTRRWRSVRTWRGSGVVRSGCTTVRSTWCGSVIRRWMSRCTRSRESWSCGRRGPPCWCLGSRRVIVAGTP